MVSPIAGGRRRIDHVLDPDFVAGLTDLPLTDLRDRRREAMQEDADLSYLRRMLQGRIDILLARTELAGYGPDDLAERLSRILASPPRAKRSSRSMLYEPTRLAERRRYVERLISDIGLSDVEQMTGAGVDAALDRLRAEERSVSEVRSSVHEVIDVLTVELSSRYRSGEAPPAV